jgi:hypothetical protein
MIKSAIISLIRKAIFIAIGLCIILLIGYFASDRKDYPGKAQFEKVDSLIRTSSGGVAYGDSDDTRAAASAFSTSMKTMQAALFSGGSGRSFATGGNFLTYVKRTPNAVVILCHVPELRNYKDATTRETLAKIAWSSGKAAATKIPGVTGSDTLIIGLRGFGSYGPIWEGTISGEATKKTDDLNEKKRLYPFFVEAGQGA